MRLGLFLCVVLAVTIQVYADDAWITDPSTGKQYTVLKKAKPQWRSGNHDDDQKICSEIGGHLAEPRSEEENNFLASLGLSAFGLGMTDEVSEGTWTWDSDNCSVTWSNWMGWTKAKREPNGGSEENCALMVRDVWKWPGHDPKGWADVTCDSPKFINIKNVVCERAWITDPSTGKQYIVLKKAKSQWRSGTHDDDQKICSEVGGHLAEPRSEEENNFLASLGTSAFRLGMSDNTTEDTWTWDSDDSSVTWVNWMNWTKAKDEPNGGSVENCAIMVRDDWPWEGHDPKGWADVTCDPPLFIKIKNVVCEREPQCQSFQ